MSEGVAGLTCPECDGPLLADEEWIITDRSLLGTTVGSGESIQGYYAHARCVEPTRAFYGGESA